LRDFGNLGDNLAVLQFPQLSRKPALKTRGKTLDPTLRDQMENGMETTRARYTRRRREWAVSIDAMTPVDVEILDEFVEKLAVFGANVFSFEDTRDKRNPKQYFVRFPDGGLPSYADAGFVKGELRQNCTFTIREV
jgi:hypothetical protein